MELEKRRYQLLKWITKILATAIIVFGLPFYFGYGNPLPFINPEYSIWDNTWLTVFPHTAFRYSSSFSIQPQILASPACKVNSLTLAAFPSL
jgi:hypothetical protein